ncbi:MAG: TonB-dependent receptor [Flavipsychrobacter sp.]|nr:TonB-dependent receptor [Flavipsychrobacter sp.]
MARFYTATLLLFVLALPAQVCRGQNCTSRVSGYVADGHKNSVTGAFVTLLHTSLGAATDTGGYFSISNVCLGTDTLLCQSIGHKALLVPVNVTGDILVRIAFAQDANELQEVIVNGIKQQDLRTVTTAALTGLALLQTRGSSLGDALKDMPGLNAIQTGPSLSKPVIHGLHSNRVLIINDGVRQEGQQWGSEHAPEIDPFAANKITIVKGAASVRYGSDAIGGVVLVNPDDMPVQKGITGDVYLVGATNGQMAATSASLQGAFGKGLTGLSWRVQGTLKDAGNFHTPHYYLTNSGLREGDFSADLAYKWKGFDFSIHYSLYNTEVGIFFGAENGNLQELQQKFAMTTPGIPSYFIYTIDRPYQAVSHELVKAVSSYSFSDKGKLELIFGRQNDIRQEYDELTTTNAAAENSPQLRFQLITHTLDLVYTQHASKGFSGSFGITGKTSGNTFEGVRSLIPNYRDYNGGAFAIERYTAGKFTFEAGLRFDYRWLRVYERNPTNLALYNVTYQYQNASGTIGSSYHYNDHLSASLNAGTGWRPPSINEMYINGVHFSDASYDIGDSTLKSERSVNTGLSVNYTTDKFRAVVDAYYNSIHNFIYNKPALTYRELASGTFPVFDYTQANVNIRGLDAVFQYDVTPHVTVQSKTTIVRGYNRSIHNWQIGMPCDRFQNSVEYHLTNIRKLQHPYVSLDNVSVAKQIRVPPNSDYVPPPSCYSLFNTNVGFTIPAGKKTLDVSFTVNNITNVAYRDYLDHFRYYADELGINYILRFKYSF